MQRVEPSGTRIRSPRHTQRDLFGTNPSVQTSKRFEIVPKCAPVSWKSPILFKFWGSFFTDMLRNNRKLRSMHMELNNCLTLRAETLSTSHGTVEIQKSPCEVVSWIVKRIHTKEDRLHIVSKDAPPRSPAPRSSCPFKMTGIFTIPQNGQLQRDRCSRREENPRA